jgi:hypothetical protein
MTESKFGLLHCIEYQKTLYTAHQLRGSAGAWWASYIAALPVDHTKLKEFLDLEQGNHSVFDYTR